MMVTMRSLLPHGRPQKSPQAFIGSIASGPSPRVGLFYLMKHSRALPHLGICTATVIWKFVSPANTITNSTLLKRTVSNHKAGLFPSIRFRQWAHRDLQISMAMESQTLFT